MSELSQRQQEIIRRIEQLQADLTALRTELSQATAETSAALREANVSAQNAYIAAKEASEASDAAKASAVESRGTRKAVTEFVAVGTGLMLLVSAAAIVFNIATYLQARASQRLAKEIQRVLV